MPNDNILYHDNFYTKWWYLEIEVGLFGLLTIIWKHHSWIESIQVEQQKKEKGRKNNKQVYIYTSYLAAEMEFFEYYVHQFLPQIFQVVWFEFSPCFRLQIIWSFTSKWLV